MIRLECNLYVCNLKFKAGWKCLNARLFLSKKLSPRTWFLDLQKGRDTTQELVVSFIIHEIYEAALEESFPARLCVVRAPGAYNLFHDFPSEGRRVFSLHQNYFPSKFSRLITRDVFNFSSKFAFLHFPRLRVG